MGFELMNSDVQVSAADKYVKFPTPSEVDGATETVLRVLDTKAVGVFRHWIGEDKKQRPYNCPGSFNGCPACKERSIAMLTAKAIENEDARKAALDAVKKQFKMDRKYGIRVLINGEVKLWLISEDMGKKLTWLEGKYGKVKELIDGKKVEVPKYTLVDMDVVVVKRKTGERMMDITYDVVFDSVRELDELEVEAIKASEIDVEKETAPASIEEIAAAMRGDVPSNSAKTDGAASPEQIAEIDRLRGNKFTWKMLADVETPENGLTYAKAEEILQALR